MARKRRKTRMPEEEQMPEPPMTPMIDVIFQLLIYFMLTMKFKDVEGKLRSQLPKNKGLASASVSQPELHEVRIYFCVDPTQIARHRNNKGRHEKENMAGFESGAMKNIETHIYVERNIIGVAYLTSHENHKNKAAHNKTIYQNTANEVFGLWDMTPSYQDESQKAPVIIDGDSEVPFEHIAGIVDALKAKKVDNVEFVGNCRFDEFYGNRKRGQFKP